MFFCKYNDPIYVKKEKLEILVKLVSDRNVDQVLLELKEYASEVDVDFVRKAVRTIGRCAIKLEVAAERCIKVCDCSGYPMCPAFLTAPVCACCMSASMS